MDCDVPHWLGGEENTLYKGRETSLKRKLKHDNIEGKKKEIKYSSIKKDLMIRLKV